MVANDLARIRAEAPLVLNVTNYVVMNTTANALLALGASPVMAHAVEEVEDMVALARAVVLNIGTLSAPWIESMRRAGVAARRRGVPVVLDPVGCGATPFRTRTVAALMAEVRPTVVRGNASEIQAMLGSGPGAKGVDSRSTPDAVADDARRLAATAGCVVSVSGPVDLIVDGTRSARFANGDPLMTRVTGMGCTASAVTGAFLAVADDPFEAAAGAMAVMGVAGEMTAAAVRGPGSFQAHFLDTLHGLAAADLAARLRRTDA